MSDVGATEVPGNADISATGNKPEASLNDLGEVRENSLRQIIDLSKKVPPDKIINAVLSIVDEAAIEERGLKDEEGEIKYGTTPVFHAWVSIPHWLLEGEPIQGYIEEVPIVSAKNKQRKLEENTAEKNFVGTKAEFSKLIVSEWKKVSKIQAQMPQFEKENKKALKSNDIERQKVAGLRLDEKRRDLSQAFEQAQLDLVSLLAQPTITDERVTKFADQIKEESS